MDVAVSSLQKSKLRNVAESFADAFRKHNRSVATAYEVNWNHNKSMFADLIMVFSSSLD